MARRLQRTAVVELLLTVGPDGRVTAAQVVSPERGLGFDEAARQAGLSAQYAPGTEGGRPIEMKTRLAIRFEL
jgi:TonB family protein